MRKQYESTRESYYAVNSHHACVFKRTAIAVLGLLP
jgi:hypothetical protein